MAEPILQIETDNTAREWSIHTAPVSTALPEHLNLTPEENAPHAYAQVRNGELTVLLERAEPNQKYRYTVKPADSVTGKDFRVVVKPEGDAKALAVYVDGEHVTTYRYADDQKKPFLWPLHGENGVGLTRDWPMVPNAPGAPKDHPHQKSFWTAYGDVNGADLWVETEESGFQRTVNVTYGSGDVYGWIHAVNEWQDKEHKPLLTEEREYRFYATPGAKRFVDVSVTFIADRGDVKFGDTKEGGIVAFRMRHDICGPKAQITNALGDKGEKTCWGKPAAWCDFSGDIPNAGVRGLAIFDHPSNLRHPTCWHVREYGLMGANCFGYSHFVEKDYNKGLIPENGDYVLPSGNRLRFQYRIYLHTGDVEAAGVARHYQDYTTPLRISLTE